LHVATGGGDDERLRGLGERPEQRRRREREVAADDDQRPARVAERRDDPDERVDGLGGLGDDLDLAERRRGRPLVRQAPGGRPLVR
jgi:hypothetical protein